jgi:hypothetical protein
MGTGRVTAELWEVAGYGPMPARNPAHADPEWFQCDLDDEIEDPDEPWLDPLPTLRHRQIPD